MISLEKVLKEILLIYSRYMTLHTSELPTDVLMNIQSFLLRKPEELRLKYNKKFNELQKVFKINYIYDELDVDYNCDGKLYSLENEFTITGRKLSLNLLLQQEDRMKKIIDEAYNMLTKDKDFDSRSDSVYTHCKIKMYGEMKYRFSDRNIFSNSIPYEGKMTETYEYLMETKDFFEERMRMFNEKEIDKFRFIITLFINRNT